MKRIISVCANGMKDDFCVALICWSIRSNVSSMSECVLRSRRWYGGIANTSITARSSNFVGIHSVHLL